MRRIEFRPTLAVYYDLNFLPNTFDAAVFLVGAECYRRKIGATGIIFSVIADSYRNLTEREALYANDRKSWRRYNIIERLPWLLPSVETVTSTTLTPHAIQSISYPANYSLFTGVSPDVYLISALSKYQAMPDVDFQPLAADGYSLQMIRQKYGDDFVTVSIRQSDFQVERNSNLRSWDEFCGFLVKKGYKVFVIPDFEDFVGDGQYSVVGAPVMHEAIFDVRLRMAAYQVAKHNFTVSNGTAALLYHSKSSFSMFKVSSDVNNCRPEDLLRTSAIRPGGKLFFMKENQFFVWENDSVSVLQNHFEKLCQQGIL